MNKIQLLKKQKRNNINCINYYNFNFIDTCRGYNIGIKK